MMGQMEVAVGRPLAVSFARASELTSLSKLSLRRLAKIGRLRTSLVGRRRVIPYSALYELLQNGSSLGESR